MLYLEWPYRSTSCALGCFCWHKTGNFSSSSFSQYVYRCSALAVQLGFFLDFDWNTVLRTVGIRILKNSRYCCL